MDDALFETLKTFCEIAAPGGREDRIHRVLAERWHSLADEVTLHPVGNLTASVHPAHDADTAPTLMLIGHGDEIGFAVTHISDDGFLFLTSGQRDDRMMPDLRGVYMNPIGQRARVIGRHNALDGVFATLTGHILLPAQQSKTVLEWTDLWVDAFLPNADAVRAAGVEIGDRVVWNPPTERHGDLVTGKALDNRVSLAIFDDLLRRLDRQRLRWRVVFASTVQEESGLIGAASLATTMHIDQAIAVDTGLSGDVPGVDVRHVSSRLGGGPIIIHKDLYSYDHALSYALADAAGAANIPVQHAAYKLYGTDAGALIRQGVPAAALAVPTRYTHSPFETAHLNDIARTADLLLAYLYTEKGNPSS